MKWLIVLLIVFTGTLILKVPNEDNICYTAQFAWLILSAGLLFSSLIIKDNKWLGLVLVTCIMGVIRTLLLGLASKFYLFENIILGTAIFAVYYATKRLKMNESILKFFLIPAWINIVFIYYELFFLHHTKLSGLLGNGGFTAVFLAMTLPLFLKYCKLGLPFLLSAMILCQGGVGLIVAIIVSLFYIYHAHRSVYKPIIIITLALLVITTPVFLLKTSLFSESKTRLSIFLGTLDGVKHHWLLGWGVGSYVSIMARIPIEDSKYLGIPLTTEKYVNNHPHNEILMGWWNFGILFPIFIIGYLYSLTKIFVKEKLLSASIILSGILCSLGSILTFPAWFLLMMGLGIYENKEVNYG